MIIYFFKIQRRNKNKVKKCASIISIILLVIIPLTVNAGDYTSSNPNKNSNYNRYRAKYYAETYGPIFETPYGGTGSGTSGLYADKYYNFYDDGGNCTNFVSQVLKFGYMNYQGTNRDCYSLWFYNGTYPDYSSTWTHAHWFRRHWGNVNNVGSNRAYSYKVYTVAEALDNWTTILYDMWEGDIVQYAYPNGTTYHSQVIHDWEPGVLYYAQHSTNSGAFYANANLKNYLLGIPSDYYFFTYQIKSGY